MPHLDVIVTLTAGLAFALVLGFIAVQCRLPSLVGYVLYKLMPGDGNSPPAEATFTMCPER